MSRINHRYRTQVVALMLTMLLANVSQGADLSQEEENHDQLAVISIAPLSDLQSDNHLVKNDRSITVEPTLSLNSSDDTKKISLADQSACSSTNLDAIGSPAISVDVPPSVLDVPSHPVNIPIDHLDESSFTEIGKKEEEHKNQGILSYTAKIDLEKVPLSQLTRLIAMHYEFGIPLAFDLEKVAGHIIDDLTSRLETIARNATHRLNHDRLRILSIDGGGVRGIIAAMFLVEMEKRTGKPIRELFDVVVGTSTGGILAAGLSYYSAKDLLKLYMEKSQFLFSKKLQYIGWYGAKYSHAPMESLLKEKFGEKSLKDLVIDTLLTTYSFNDHTGRVFSSEQAKLSHNENFFLWEILRASTAAPTIFEPYQIGSKIFSDGGLFLNNPVMLAIIHGMEKYGKLPHEMEVVSLGTGYAVEVQTLSGYAGLTKVAWVEELLNAFLNGNSQHALAQDLTKACSRIYGTGGVCNYHRFTVDLQKPQLDIDNYDIKNLKTLEEIARNKIKLWDKKIEELCNILTKKNIVEERS